MSLELDPPLPAATGTLPGVQPSPGAAPARPPLPVPVRLPNAPPLPPTGDPSQAIEPQPDIVVPPPPISRSANQVQ
jgi:hypothetical protein